MFTPSGQVDLLSFAGVRGGSGKGGSGGGDLGLSGQSSFVDPVSGKAYNNAQGLNEAIDFRKGEELTQSVAQEQAGKVAEEQRRTDFNSRSAQAALQGGQNVDQYFRNYGVDPERYRGEINLSTNTAQKSIPDMDPNPLSVYDNLGARIFNELTGGRQTQATARLNEIFTPTYAENKLQYGAIDPFVNDILNSQLDPLSAQLGNAQKRGSLNDTGYQAALDALAKSRTSGASTLRNIGTGVIDTDRAGIDSYISGARNDASSLMLNNADTFDPNQYAVGAQTRVDNYLSSLGGDIQNALGDTAFTDLASLLNAGGAVQGANDPSAANPNGLPTPNWIADQALKTKPRGLGTEGAF